jgi:hypothetical protein
MMLTLGKYVGRLYAELLLGIKCFSILIVASEDSGCCFILYPSLDLAIYCTVHLASGPRLFQYNAVVSVLAADYSFSSPVSQPCTKARGSLRGSQKPVEKLYDSRRGENI